MKRWWILAVLGTLSCKAEDKKNTVVVDETGVSAPGPRSVVVLVMDGVRIEESFGDGVSASGADASDVMPTLREVIATDGALASAAHVTGMTRTGPGHVDLVVGRHLPFANYPVETDVGSGAYLPELPTLFESLEPGEGWLIGNGPLIAPAYRSLYPGTRHPGATLEFFGPSDPGLLTELRGIITESQPRLIVVNLHDIDRAGHSGETGASGEPTYVEHARELDQEIASFWSWLQEQPGYGADATLVITSDHGRHRLGEEGDWAEHGDQCTGCREIPMALLGSGIRPGVVVEEPQTLLDLHQTIAALLGVEAPYSQGRPIAAVLAEDVAVATAPDGAVHPSAAGGRLIYQDNRSDGARSQIVDSDGQVLSSAGAWMAEEPVVAAVGGQPVAAWRELHLDSASSTTSWQAMSARWDGSAWVDVPLALGDVESYWRPVLISNGDALWLLSVDNPNGHTINGTDPLDVELLRFSSDSQWAPIGSLLTAEQLSFPTGLSAHLGAGEIFYAISSADPRGLGRFTRRVELHRAVLPSLETTRLFAAGPADTEAVTLDLVVEGGRVERPAVWADGDTLHLAMLVYDDTDNGVELLLVSSSDAGESWGAPVQASTTDRVLGHLSPQWSDGRLWWLELASSTLQLCSLVPGDAADCADTGQGFAEGLSIDGETAWLGGRSDGAAPWTLVSLP